MRRVTLKACAFFLSMAAITMAGCGGGGSSGSDTLPGLKKLTVENYPVSGILKETDGYAMQGTITLSATDSTGAAVNLYSDKTGGTKVTSIVTTDSGIVTFFVDSAARLPVTVKAFGTTTVPNHISSSTKFTIEKVGATQFAINIIDMEGSSPGVVSHLENGTLGDLDDFLKTTLSLSNSSALVTIPSGTAFKDSDGVILKGAVNASLTTFASSTATTPIIDPAAFDPSLSDPENDKFVTLTQSDLENFPGGLGNSQSPAGDGYFVTAGFVAVNMVDASGNQAKSVNPGNSFTIRMNIPAGTLNLGATNEPLLKAGDSIPIFTYDETNLVWKSEVAAGVPVTETVLADANGLYVLHTTNHFSFWNLGWLVKGKSCSATLNLQNDAVALPLSLSASFTKKGKNTLLSALKPAGDAAITASNVPNDFIDMVLTDSLNKVVWSKKNVNWCLGTPLTANYVAPASKKPVPVTVKVTEYCKQDPKITQVVPSTTTSVTTTTTKPGAATLYITLISTGVTDSTGSFIFNLAAGTYNFSAFDRRTATYIPATIPTNPVTVVKAVPQTVSVKIPVLCIPFTGSTGGTSYGF